MAKTYKSILIISDLHLPFQHKDIFDFYKKLKREVNPDLVICIGDEIDGHAWSYHEEDQSAYGPDQEFELALTEIKKLYKIFPAAHCMHSNHGSLHERKAKTAKIPSAFIKSYKEAFEAPPDWHWHQEFKALMSNQEQVLFHHGMGANAFTNAMDLGVSMVQGHHHGRLEAVQKFCPFMGKNIFGMTVGCGIDSKAYAFKYGVNFSRRPKIGAGLIINSAPIPVPLILNKHGRWINKLQR